jgi:hypothetical protein
MLRLLYALLYLSIGLGLYGAVQAQASLWEPISVKPLDPIDPSIVGCVKLKDLRRALERGHLRKSRLAEVVDALLWTTSAEDRQRANERGWEWIETVQMPRKSVGISKRYEEHVVQLERCGILRPVERGEIRYLSGYFAVDKGPNASRAIFSGRGISELSPVPPPVNLLAHRKLVEVIKNHLEKHKRTHAILGDLRHWFHQIPVGTYVGRLFGLRLNDRTFRWRTLPMGWAWSPYMAQSLCWAALIHRESPEEKKLFNDDAFVDPKGSLPFYVTTPSEGIAMVYYDNYIILTPCENERKAIEARLRRNFEILGIRVKEQCVVSPEDFCTEGMDYLGIHFQGISDNNPRKVNGVKWWASGLRDWQKSREEIAERSGMDIRQAASLVGQCIFNLQLGDLGLSGGPLGLRILNLARQVSRLGFQSQWRGDVNGELGRELIHVHEVMCQLHSTWESRFDAPAMKGQKTEIVVASDASLKGYGWVIGVRDKITGKIQRLDQFNVERIWEEEEKGQHIYLYELRAIAQALETARGMYPEGEIHLVTDNSAVYFSMGNRFSMNEAASAILRNVDPEGWRISLVVSQDNPADCCSRGSYRDLDARWRRLEEALATEDKGYRSASAHPSYRREAEDLPISDEEGIVEFRHAEEFLTLRLPGYASATGDTGAEEAVVHTKRHRPEASGSS